MLFCADCKTNPVRPSQSQKGGYCSGCHNARMREWRKTHPLTGVARMKANCRAYTHVLIRRGVLVKGLCEVCDVPEVESHHDDYTKPREVRWLCVKHHRAHHRAAA
jgi:hypothetical protein